MRLATLTISLLLPAALAAQAADSLPFRAGQWGAEFEGVTGYGGVGLMRFSSPRRAWVFNVHAGYTATDVDKDPAVFRGQEQLDSNAGSVFARFGSRWFRSAGPRILQQLSLGVEVGGSRTSREVTTDSLRSTDLQSHTKSLGAFGEVGAAWMVTPKLSLGAAYGMTAGYVSGAEEILMYRGEGVGGPSFGVRTQRRSGWNASAGQVSIRAALYF